MGQSNSFSISCPVCSTRLRLKRQLSGHREFDCPDCGSPVQIDESGPDAVCSLRDSEPDLVQSEDTPVVGRKLPALPKWKPQQIAGIVVALIAVPLFWIVLGGTRDSESHDTAANQPTSRAWTDSHSTVDGEAAEVGEKPDVLPVDVSEVIDAVGPGSIVVNNADPNSSVGETDVDVPTHDALLAGASAGKLPTLADIPDALAVTDTPVAGGIPKPEADVVPAEPEGKETETAELTPPPPPPLRIRLSLEIAGFNQPMAVAAEAIIQQVEQMAAVKIDTSGVARAVLEKRLSLSLKSTTPREILLEIAQRIGVQVEITESSIRLKAED